MSSEYNTYPELQALRNFINTHSISVVRKDIETLDDQLQPVEFNFSNQTTIVFIQDEYNDLALHNELLDVILALYQLLIIDDSEDFLVWCKWLSLQAGNMNVLNYYKGICQYNDSIRSKFPNQQITAFVSDLDFELNSGALKFLRATSNN